MQFKRVAGSTRRIGHVCMGRVVHAGVMTRMEDVMEKKTFAFKLAEKSPRDTGKWKARDGVAVAGCTDFRFPNNLRYSDNGVYC